MLLHSLVSEQAGTYVQQISAHFRHQLNVAAFEQAWQKIVERHDVFRTSFHWDGEAHPIQKVHAEVELPFRQEDWSDLPPVEQMDRLKTYLAGDRLQGFAVDEAPLMRLALFKLSDADYRFVWTNHHALLDGRSRALVFKELFALYEALDEGRHLELNQPAPYRDYIAWLHALDLSPAEAFWKNLLDGFAASTQFAIAPPLESSREAGHAETHARLSAELTAALLKMAAPNGLTLNTILQGAWALLLSRYSDQDDVVFGTTRACRKSVPGGADNMVGLFINTIPVRVRLSADDRLIPWLQRLRGQHLAVRDYEHTPLLSIQSWSQVPRGTPLFESVVVFENTSLDSGLKALGGDWQKRTFSLHQQANFPLILAGHLDSELCLRLEYDRSRFSEPAAAQMLRHLQTLLQAMAEDPERRVLDLEMLSHRQRHQLLVEYNDTARDYPQDRLVPELFEDQAAQRPDQTAVVCGEEQLSYAQLNERANRLAHYLRELGVGPDEVVGICLERSVDLIVAIIGVLKAGAAYLPLDPAYPAQRLAFMMEDSGMKVVLSRERMRSILPPHHIPQIDIEAAGAEIEKKCVANPAPIANQDNAAYVIYTSGSTGQPKGAVICHKSVVNLLTALQEAIYRRLPAEPLRVSLNGPIAFDTSVKQLIQLSAGHTLHIVSEATREDPGRLLAFVNARALDVLDCTPSMLGLLIHNGLLKQAQRPAAILLGGEPIDQATWQLLAATEKQPFHNVYGPTECTVNATTHHITEPEQASIIGRPIANVRVYVLDRHLHAVPEGVNGELYIAGAGVGRGYLGKAELTAERFVPDPFSPAGGDRMYRTGDVCRWRVDGEIEYIGRADHQVKVRGYRIELGEVESALRSQAGVAEAAAVVREDRRGDKRLVAYVVPSRPQPGLSSSQWRRLLRDRLPDYMLPSAIVELASLPLTPNGKLDRRALPEPPSAEAASGGGPEGAVEEILAGIWAEVLGVGEVGREANFFDLGGHSLLATQVVSRIRQALQVEVSLRRLFESPTVAGLAAVIAQARATGGAAAVEAILPLASRQGVRLSGAQERLWLLNELQPGSAAYNIPAAWRLRGRLEVAALEQSLGEIVRRHEVLRTQVGMADEQPVQVITPASALLLEVCDLRELDAAERQREAKRQARQEAGRPFDLSRAPMLRARLLRLADDDHLLLLTVHHIASDGWSSAILISELVRLYEALGAGQPSGLAELPIQYGDYAAWQRARCDSPAFAEALGYWRRQLGGELPALELPTDHARPA
ncbi:MAG TPA: amino acid adenylation domain-containing protein, partial [Blastocatellia bacterium]|nr:amino acid adenylation domain-containing protein [Blastocatellia bacterium]